MTYNLKLILIITLGLSLISCERAPLDSPASEVPETTQESAISAERFLANVSELASDEYGGRAPMSPGEELTLSFLQEQFQEAGLEPLFGESFLQAVPLISMTVDSKTASMSFNGPDGEQSLRFADDFVAWTQRIEPSVTVEDSEIVFVGYGVVAPEYNWNDYAGIDMQGKTALILVNDPGFALEDEALFKGRAMTYYGRWIYKLEEAARQGATGAIVIHETEPASYGWNTVRNSWTSEGFYLPSGEEGPAPVALSSWVQRDIANQLLARAGHDLETLKQEALSGEFKPLPLGITMSGAVENTITRGESYNVGGLLRGSEAPDEAIVYTAHWDHIGTAVTVDPELDVIFNGAIDNASGTAALIELAHAYNALPNEPRRSVVFLAVTAEESGKLGSEWYAANPVFPMSKTVGGINMDAMPAYGPTNDIMVVGYGASELEDILAAAASEQNRTVTPEATPERGSYYRSDHFSFAKKGVPMLYAKAGTEHREKGAEYIKEMATAFNRDRYHQPGDEVLPSWDIRGIMEDIELYYQVGLDIADSEKWPEWYPGNEFRATREASLR